MSVVLDVGVVAQVAQVALGAFLDALVLEFAHDLVEVRSGSRLRIVASAQHEYADAFFERAEGRGGLADLQLQDDVLQLLRQGTDADLIVGHDIRAEFGGDVFRVTAATDFLYAFGEAGDALLGRGLGRTRIETDLDLLEAENGIARIGHQHLAPVDQVKDRIAARNGDRPDELTGGHFAGYLFELLVVNNWNVIMCEAVAVSNDWARVYFISWFILAVMVMSNLIVAHILDGILIEEETPLDGPAVMPGRAGLGEEREAPIISLRASTASVSQPRTQQVAPD